MKKKLFFAIIIAAFGCLKLSAQPFLYGVASSGGANGYGTLFKFDAASNALVVKKNFDYSSDGATPYGKLLYASNGMLYGTAYSGGTSDNGTLFEYDPQTDIFTTKINFDYDTTGAYSYGDLIQLDNGDIIGTCPTGGANGYGTIWKYEILSNTITKLKDFDSTSGTYPQNGGITQASNGKLYGVTALGGTSDVGTLYELDPQTNSFTVLESFNNSNGANGIGKLVEVNGKLYGVTLQGGDYNYGTIFEYDIADSLFTTRLSFDFYTNGSTPYVGLNLASDGLLYGTNQGGGQYSNGVLFSFDPVTGNSNHLYSFDAGVDGNSFNPVIEASDGHLYGMIFSLRFAGYGSIYKYDIGSNTYTTIFNFDYDTTGAYPYSTGLTEISQGNTCESLAAASVADTIICSGDSANVIVSATGGTAPYNGTGSFAVAAGTYTYTVTDANGCTANTSVTVAEADTIAATAGYNGSVCAGSTLSLTSSGGASYAWSGPDGFTSSLQNPTRVNSTGAMSGVYTVTVTNTLACTNTATVNVVINPLPGTPTAIAGTASVLRGGTYTYSVSIANASSYSWNYSGTGAAISGDTNSVTITYSCNATDGNLTVNGVNSCGNGATASIAITTNPGATINVYSSKFTIGSGCHPTTVKSAIMPINEAGTNSGFKIFRSNKIGITAKRKNFDNIWNGNCTGVSGSCSYDPSSNVTASVTVTGPILVNQGGGPAYKYTITVPAGKRYLVLGKYDGDPSACAIYNSGEPPCYVYPGKRTFNRNNNHDQCDEDDNGDDDGDDDSHFNSCQSKDMYLGVIQDANGKIRPSNTDAVKGSLLLICSPDYISFIDTVELLPIIYESVDGSWEISTNATPPEGFYSVPDTSLSTEVLTSVIGTLQFTLVDTGSIWTNTVVKTQLKHNGKNVTHYVSPDMIDNKNFSNYLSQNLPNPFSSSTTIPYFLPFESNVNLSVYDIMGKKIITLVDETQQSGQHNKIWDGCDKVNCDLPGGVYVVRLKVTSFDNKHPVLNSKMMLYIK